MNETSENTNPRFWSKVATLWNWPFWGILLLRAKPINAKYAIFRHFKDFALLYMDNICNIVQIRSRTDQTCYQLLFVVCLQGQHFSGLEGRDKSGASLVLLLRNGWGLDENLLESLAFLILKSGTTLYIRFASACCWQLTKIPVLLGIQTLCVLLP